MSDTTSERFRRVNDAFVACINAVPDDAWDNPAPCDGWVARDVVDHLVEWVPDMLARGDVEFRAPGDWPSVAADIQRALDDPAIANHKFDVGPPGEMTVEQAVGMLVVGDVLVHTWDLATATGQTVQLDPATVHDQMLGMAQMGDALEQSGHFGPVVPVPDDADEQTKMLGLSGRRV